MNRPLRLRAVAALSLVFTYLFFFEYLPPFRRVFIPYDLDGFHYPLADYAFQAVRQGRFPQWDPTIYCGLSFDGNPQTALFYPPTWLLFAANLGRRTLSYQSLQTMVILHVWAAFVLCYAWLRRKRLAPLASALGGAVFAYSGYMLLQLQHLGLIGGYTWMPLGLWGIDDAIEQRRWRPLWKLLAASALCFLAGYPPIWVVFAVAMVSYAAWRWRVALATVAALGLSLLVAAVQLLPAWQATQIKEHEPRYGTGYRDPEYFVSYLVPNYFDFGMHTNPAGRPSGEYLYLGAPAFLGLACLVRRRRRDLVPPLMVAAVSAVFVTNPHGLVGEAVEHSRLLDQVVRDWYFLAGITLAAAPLAAMGLDDFLQRSRRPAPRWLVLLAIALLAGWSLRELLAFFPIGADFPSGWKSAIQPAITLALFSLALFVLPGEKGPVRASLIVALLLCVGIDYKVFGTSKRFNANAGRGFSYSRDSFPAMDPGVFRQLRANAHYRIVVDQTGPFPQALRHLGLATPQGFDPFLTTQYRKVMERIAHFRTNWLIDIAPENHAALRLLGVRYFISAESGPLYPRLAADPSFRRLTPSEQYYKVFEFTGARPPYGWVEEDGKRSARLIRWEPEARGFTVRSETGGQFALVEQLFPGWRATVDGVPARLERWNEAFQAIRVPAGEHRVEFIYRSPWLRVGALLSLASIAGLALLLRRK